MKQETNLIRSFYLLSQDIVKILVFFSSLFDFVIQVNIEISPGFSFEPAENSFIETTYFNFFLVQKGNDAMSVFYWANRRYCVQFTKSIALF